MTERQENIIKILTSAAVVFLVLVVIALIINLSTVAVLRSRKNALQKQYEALTLRNTAMANEIDYKSTDAFIEQYAREVLGMIKEGESIIIAEPA